MTSFPGLMPSLFPSMEDITVSCECVVKLLENLKLHKAAGPDDILLEEVAKEIALAITLRFHAYLNQANTPLAWCKTLVPIFRKGSKSDASSYRP